MSNKTKGTAEEESSFSSDDSVEVPIKRQRMPKVGSRFLFVELASRRATQLRRGALPRLSHLAPDPETGARPTPNSKLERIAMAEIDEGHIIFDAPDPKTFHGSLGKNS